MRRRHHSNRGHDHRVSGPAEVPYSNSGNGGRRWFEGGEDTEALRESEELYRTVVEQAVENIFLVDTETRRILEANSMLHKLVGYQSEELRRMTL